MKLVVRSVMQRWAVAMAAVCALFLGTLPASAAVDTAFSDIVTDLTTYFGSIKTLVISVVVFGLVIGYAKLIRRK